MNGFERPTGTNQHTIGDEGVDNINSLERPTSNSLDATIRRLPIAAFDI